MRMSHGRLMGRSRVTALSIGLLLLLAGCTDDPETNTGTATVQVPPSDANNTTVQSPTDLVRNGSFAQPNWTLGKWWAQHMFFGPDDSTGTHTNIYVARDDGDAWLLATENEGQARRDAQEDLFNLGTFGKATASTTFQGEPWDWYEWPLEVNKSWHRPLIINGNVQHTDFKVTFDAERPTAQGNLPGFVITGETPTNKILEYDFIPQLGWYANLEIYDPSTDPDNPMIRIINMGFGENKTGVEWRVFEPAPLLSQTYKMSGNAPDGELRQTVTVAAGTGSISGTITIALEGGLGRVTLIDPDGTEHEFDNQDNIGPSTETHNVLIRDVPAGDWELRILGAARNVEITIELIAETVIVGTI